MGHKDHFVQIFTLQRKNTPVASSLCIFIVLHVFPNASLKKTIKEEL